MKKFLFKSLSKYFKNELEDSFIENEMKAFKLDKNSPKILEKLSDLYQSPDYRIFAKMISNRAKNLAIQSMKLRYSSDKELSINHSFIRGQIFGAAFGLRIVKHANLKYQNLENKEKGENK